MGKLLVAIAPGSQGERLALVRAEARECLALVANLGPNQRLALSLQIGGFAHREIIELTGKTHTWANRHITERRARLRRLGTT